jgi:hypothetical protein
MEPGSTMDAFSWLRDPWNRRSALATVHTAVRRGWLDGPEMAGRRSALVDALVGLMDDPTVRPAETLRIARIFAAMQGAQPPSRLLR